MLSCNEEQRIEKFVRDVMDSDSDATPVKTRSRQPTSHHKENETVKEPSSDSQSVPGLAVLETISQLHGEDPEDKAIEALRAQQAEDEDDELDEIEYETAPTAAVETWLPPCGRDGDESVPDVLSRAEIWMCGGEDDSIDQDFEAEQEAHNEVQSLSLETKGENLRWVKLQSIKGRDGTEFDYEGEVLSDLPEGYGRAWWEGGASYRGVFKNGRMDGIGELVFKRGDRFHGRFREGKAVESGVLISQGRRFKLTFNSERDMLNDDLLPEETEEMPELVIESSVHIITSAVMKGGKGHTIGDFGHIRSCEGKLAFASPFRAHRPLHHPETLRGKIAVVQRGECSLHKKLRYVQEAGAVAMLLVGTDNCTTFNHMLWIVQGQHTEEDDTYGEEEDPKPLYVCIPVFYILGNYEHILTDGAVCRVVFGERTPRTPLNFRLGTIVIPAQTVYADESQSAKNKLLSDFREARKREREEEVVMQKTKQTAQQDRHSAPALGAMLQDSFFRFGLFRPHSSAYADAKAGAGTEGQNGSGSLIITPRPRRQQFPGWKGKSGSIQDVFAVPFLALNEMIAGSCSGMTMGATNKDLASLFGFGPGGDQTPRSQGVPAQGSTGVGGTKSDQGFRLELPKWIQPWRKDSARGVQRKHV